MVNVPMLWVSRCYPPVSVSLACVAVLGYVGQRMIINFDALLPDFNSPSSNHVSLCKRLSFMLSRICVRYLDAFSVIKIVTCPSWVGERCFWPFNMNQIKAKQTLHARLLALQDQPHRDTYCWRPCVLFGPQTLIPSSGVCDHACEVRYFHHYFFSHHFFVVQLAESVM